MYILAISSFYCYRGGNERGQLGLGDTVSRFKPEVVKALQGTYINIFIFKTKKVHFIMRYIALVSSGSDRS